jgi:hypothetical protein
MLITHIRGGTYNAAVIVFCLVAISAVLAGGWGPSQRSRVLSAFRVAEIVLAFAFLYNAPYGRFDIVFGSMGLLVMLHAVTPMFWKPLTS